MPQRARLAAFEENALAWFIEQEFVSVDELIGCDPPADSATLCPCTVAYIKNAILYAPIFKKSDQHVAGPSIETMVETAKVPVCCKPNSCCYTNNVSGWQAPPEKRHRCRASAEQAPACLCLCPNYAPPCAPVLGSLGTPTNRLLPPLKS